MDRVIFDYTIQAVVIQRDKKNEISNLKLDELKSIANGRMLIFFEPQRKYIILETGIIDYLIQIKGIIEEIESGNSEPFSVSCDFYSNSLDYEYNTNTGILKIREVNENLFEIKTKYKLFKNTFEKFYNRSMKELEFFYPELRNNSEFCKIRDFESS